MTPATAEAAAPVTISLTDASARAIAALVAKHGGAQRAAIESGVARVASRWSAADGDAAAFDSRVLHCGCANDSQKRRVLFYITVSRDAVWPLPDGLHGSNSIRAEDLQRWRLPDLLALPEEG